MESIAACLKASFKRYNKKTAISFFRGDMLETRISFTKLDLKSNKIANMFLNSGIKKSDNVVLLLDKSLIFIVIYIALQKIGAVCVPLNPGFKKFELSYLLNDADPSLVIINPDKTEIIKQINPHLNCRVVDTDIPFQKMDFFESFSDNLKETKLSYHDPGLIIYTSGTTGNPKGAVLTQKNLVHDAENIIEIWEISDADTICHTLPLFHIHGLCFALHTALISGAHVVMTDKFIPETVMDLLSNGHEADLAALKRPLNKYRNSYFKGTLQEFHMKNNEDMVCSVFMGVPAMYAKLIACIQDPAVLNFDHMRLWTSGSAPLLSKDFLRIKQLFGKEPVEREGMSETGMNFSNPLGRGKKPGSIGIPLPGLNVRIVDPDTSLDVQPRQIGELWLKSDSITNGYWRKPEETSEAFEQGWFKTGDLGKKDSDGYYYITDRIKNIIITGGENVSPNEIESVINMLDTVIDSSVAGIPDENWGEKIVAAVVKAPGSGDISPEIKNICKKHLHNWKCPKKIIFIEKLPRNTMGKILKKEVKKLFST